MINLMYPSNFYLFAIELYYGNLHKSYQLEVTDWFIKMGLLFHCADEEAEAYMSET